MTQLTTALWYDVYWMARAAAGEGAGLFGDQRDQVARAILDCVMDRYDRGWWGKDIPALIYRPNGFHGYVNVTIPPAWAIEAAVDRRWRQGSTLPRPAYFMLDLNDLVRNGWLQFADRALAWFKQGRHELYFFDRWPQAWEVGR